MRNRIITFVAALTMICSITYFSIPAAAANPRWPNSARNVEMGTAFTETGTTSDPYLLNNASYVDSFRFQVPESGNITIYIQAETNAVPFIRLYTTNNTEQPVWYGYDDTRAAYDYDYDNDVYWSVWTVDLEEGNYYLQVLHNWDSLGVPLTYYIDYTN